MSRSAVLAHIGAHGPTPRAQLARVLDLSPAMITQITKRLIAEGLLVELDNAPSSIGRPAQALGLAHDAPHAIGVKVAPDHVTCVEVKLDGSVARESTQDFDTSGPTALESLTSMLRAFVEQGGDQPLLGIGVGIPGDVHVQSEGIVDSTQLGWERLPLGETLRRELELPVLIDNNVNALAHAETLYGAGRDRRNILIITIGTGIGAGIVNNGSVMRGDSGSAGEIGHFPTILDGPSCQCGAHGCLEAIIGEKALVSRARERGIISRSDTIDALHTAAHASNADARALFEQAGHLLGRTAAGLVNTIDPSLVVVLGEGVESWQHWSVGFEPAFRAGLIPRKRGTGVAVERWQDDRWAQGAACLVLATPFDEDGISGEQGRLVRARLLAAQETVAPA